MSSEPPPPGAGQPPDDDPFKKQPPTGGPGGGSPYDAPGGGSSAYGPPPGAGGPPPPGGGGPYGTPPPYGGDPYGGGGGDPLAGMPPLADSGKRVLARIIDMLMVAIVVYLLSLLFGGVRFDTDPDEVNYGTSFGQSLLAAVLYMGYDAVMISRTGQTLGKKWMGLRVANLNDGATPTLQTALIRAAVLWLPFAFCCACIWTVICGGWSFFDKPYKQGLHDKAAKTVVVTVP
ncbi:RDD family protein [Streptomyces sp. YIM 130001]|uniref:RDD family protein n=1 Tax=Streptomyces sp. YIM 130001 TaxID=2259644 RepID=UPI000E652D3A|nr:RDD family protein [Streptomyces sp. YIM 130001]RII19773.1 RDD family protein [Streptomyces sp. YIM 130001]